MIKKGYVEIPEGQVHLRRVEGIGPPIVLLHRTPASSVSFEAMLARFDGRRAAIAFDTPGFGQSFRPAGRPSTVDYARWFLAALDGLGIDGFHVCGHHTGTHFGVELARLAPQRMRSLLLSGVLYTDAATRAAFATRLGQALRPDPDGHYAVETWKFVRRMREPFAPEVIHEDFIGALLAIEGRDQAFGAVFAQDFPALLREVRCPIRVAQAVDDPLASMLAKLEAERPDIPVERLGAAQMGLPELQADGFDDAALRFAEAVDSGST